MKLQNNLKSTLSGFFRAVVTDKVTGEVKKDYGWKPNLITDIGLDMLGVQGGSGIQRYCIVGSNNTEPSVTDTTTNEVSNTVNTGSLAKTYETNQTNPSYWGARGTYIFTFSTDVNLSDVGLSDGTSNGSGDYYLFSRALFKDENGDPTTLSVLSTEVLTIYYEVRCYHSEVTSENGNIDLDHNSVIESKSYTLSCTDLYSSPTYTNFIVGSSPFFTIVYTTPSSYLTGSPSGNPGDSTVNTANATAPDTTYQTGSYENTYSFSFDTSLTSGTDWTDARVLYLRTPIGNFQYVFEENVLDKTEYEQLDVTCTIKWGRRS